jgi:ribosome-associated translation inhibitor RaiA
VTRERIVRRESAADKQVEFVVRGARSSTTEALREHALRRLSFAVRRFAHRVRQLTVRLADENGPRRGLDSRCSMTADLVDGGQLFVEARATLPFTAMTLAAKRLSQALRRDTDRHAAYRSETVATADPERGRPR